MKYDLNENFFDSFTPLSSYWLGYAMADGCIIKQHYENRYGRKNYYRNYLKFRIAEIDEPHLLKLIKDIGGNHKLYKHTSGNTEQVGVHFNSEHLVEQLLKLGMTVDKNEITMPIIPHDLEKDFFRGYIDGKGSIHNSQLNIAAPLSIIDPLQKHFEQNLRIPIQKPTPSKQSDAFFIYYGNNMTVNILKYLKTNAERFLERKYVFIT